MARGRKYFKGRKPIMTPLSKGPVSKGPVSKRPTYEEIPQLNISEIKKIPPLPQNYKVIRRKLAKSVPANIRKELEELKSRIEQLTKLTPPKLIPQKSKKR